MKILLINPPIRLDAPPSCIPYGLATIASVLNNDGHEVDIFDINGLRNSKSEVETALRHYYEEWDMVGVSGLITTLNYQRWLIPLLREINPQATIVVGGGLATSSPELVAGADLVIIGEGEQQMHNICGGNKTFGSIDSLPFPAWNLLPIGIYLRNPVWSKSAGNSSQFDIKTERSMNIISAHGCPFSCNYCYHLMGKTYYKQRSVNSVIAEVNALIHQYDIDYLALVDDNSMNSEQWMFDFCSVMANKDVEWGCHGRCSSAKPDLLNAMAEAGCKNINYGAESGSNKILKDMNKKQTADQIYDAVMNTRRAGIFPNTTWITGWPTETEETIQETIRLKKDLNIHCHSFFLQAYPDTILYSQFKDKLPENYIEKLSDATDFVYNFTDMPDEELFRLKALVDGC